MKVIVIEPGKAPIVKIINKLDLSKKQEVVKGYIELLPLFPKRKYDVYVNEEGKIDPVHKFCLFVPINDKSVPDDELNYTTNRNGGKTLFHAVYGTILICPTKERDITHIFNEWNNYYLATKKVVEMCFDEERCNDVPMTMRADLDPMRIPAF